ncbi:hypothetical protein Bbelb_381650 [Branchiostoma belcheri]|nr:hypothetical protein Bbelb_381650 [Branchiostoma belcheri]
MFSGKNQETNRVRDRFGNDLSKRLNVEHTIGRRKFSKKKGAKWMVAKMKPVMQTIPYCYAGHHSRCSDVDEDKLWSSGAIFTKSSTGRSHGVFFYNCKLLILRVVDECQHCLCQSCITSPVPMWFVGHSACAENAAIRRDMYRNFWGMMANLMPSPRNGRKQTRMAHDSTVAAPRRRLVIVGSVREIMLKYVVKLLPRKYTNPPGVNYMGHR